MDPDVQGRINSLIRRKGLRWTGQRKVIIQAAFAKDEHFTADELFARVRQVNLEISRATVYRTLGLMVEAELLRAIDLGDSQTTYDPNFIDKPSHNHLVCTDCGRVIEFEDPVIEDLNDKAARRLGFKSLRQTLKIEANCEQLRLHGRCPNLIATRLSGKRLRKKR